MERREKGSGTIYQRSNGRWVIQVSLPVQQGASRVRKTRYARTEGDAKAILGELISRFGITLTPRIVEGSAAKRRERVAAARLLGSHTAAEWHALVKAYGSRCYYCGTSPRRPLGKDHKVPISRGGSDGIDNLVPCCKRCNSEKLNATLDDFLTHMSREDRWARRIEAERSRGLLTTDKRPRVLDE